MISQLFVFEMVNKLEIQNYDKLTKKELIKKSFDK